MCLDRFKRKMKYSGESLREEQILNSRNLLYETFADDASFSLGIYMWEHGIKDYSRRETIGIRLFDRSFSAANGWTVKFQTLIETPMRVGDIIYDSKLDEYLICTEVFNINSIHWQGKLTLCNWILKWQNKNGDVLEYPCYDMNATQYNSGERSNEIFSIGSSQHMLTLPCDENTVILNSPQRFFLDKNTVNPTTFIVTQNDTTSHNYGSKGLVKVTVYECESNHETDRIDLGICDYFEKCSVKTDNDVKKRVAKSVIYYDTKIIKSGGDKQRFTGKFFDENGDELQDIETFWRVICTFSDELTVEEIDQGLVIGIDNDEYIDEEFKIILSDSEGNYASDLVIKVESLL